MKQAIFISTAILLLATVACKKSKTDTPPTGTPKIKTETYNSNPPTNYEYDLMGRQTLTTYNSGAKETYTYSGYLVSRKSYDNAGNLTGEAFFELNNSGFVQKITYGPASSSRYTFLYNAAGQVINEHFFINALTDSTDEINFYSPLGRLDSSWRTKNNNAAILQKDYYEYAVNKPNTISHINNGYLFYGKETSPIPPTKITYIFPSAPQQVDTYTYEYDGQNRITRRINNNGASQVTYTYY